MMSMHRLAIGAAALLGVITLSSAAAPPRLIARAAGAVPGTAPLMAFGGRSAAQLQSVGGRRLDAALADLARHAGLARPAHLLEDLHSMSPAARFMQHGPGAPALVAVDAVTRGDPQQLKDTLVSLGLEHPAVFLNDVGGWLPVSAIGTAAAVPELHSLRAAMSHTRAALATQGDYVQGTAALRGTYSSLDGTGVTVGILSDSFDCYNVYALDKGQAGDPPISGPNGWASNGFTASAESDEASGALPPASSINVLEEAGGTAGAGGAGNCLNFGPPYFLPFSDEGRAMMQIVHAVAPGAKLAFYTASDSEADFANGIGALANAGAKVIADDVGYYDEPFFQDGLIAQAIDSVNALGVAYFSAAGNNGTLAYDNTAPSFATAGGGQNAGESLLNFDTSNATNTTTLSITIPPLVPGEFIGVVLEWDQPYVTGAPTSPGASSQLDLCITGASGYTVSNLDGNFVTCTGVNSTGVDPLQVLVIGNSAANTANTPQTTVGVVIGLKTGSPVPGHVKLVWEDDGAGSTINAFATNTATLQGHPGAATAAAIAAGFFLQAPACALDAAPVVEVFSSQGGAPILFDDSGTRLATPVIRQKPDFTGPDGVNNTFLGFTLAKAGITDSSTVAGCANDAGFPNFFGTSAATPHAAALAALMLQANPKLTPAEIFQAMSKSAIAMAAPTPNYFSGAGFLSAVEAMAQLPPGPPVLTLADATIAAGDSTTLSWLAVNSSSCSASGSWSGSQKTSGSINVAPTTAGTYTYTLACMSSAGSQSASATLTVGSMPGTQPPGGGGGGGSLGGETLLALAGLAFARLWRARRRSS